MIHAVLLILKITGIILLVLLELLLLVLLAVLFVPVRYRVNGQWDEKHFLEAGVSWLCRIVSLRGSFGEEGLKLRLKLFMFTLWSNEGNGPDDAELMDDAQAVVEAAETSAAQERETALTADDKAENGTENVTAEAEAPRDTGEIPPETKQKMSLTGRIKTFFRRAAFSFRSFCDKLKEMLRSGEKAKAWISDEKNKASLRLLWKQGKRLLKHIWPRSGKGRLRFGFDDPGTTGQVLSAAAFLYPVYGRQLALEPVFDEAVFEAEGNFKGRIRIGTILWLALGVLRDKHTRRMIFSFRR